MIALLAPWGLAALFLSATMAAAWGVRQATGQGGWADVFWSFGLCAAGAGAALYPVDGAPDARQWLAAGLAALWGVRLGAHIAGRSLSGPEDARYARLREDSGPAFQRRLFAFLAAHPGVGHPAAGGAYAPQPARGLRPLRRPRPGLLPPAAARLDRNRS